MLISKDNRTWGVIEYYNWGTIHKLDRGDLYSYDKAAKFHSEIGPAVKRNDGTEEWWYHGQPLSIIKSQQEFERFKKLKSYF